MNNYRIMKNGLGKYRIECQTLDELSNPSDWRVVEDTILDSYGMYRREMLFDSVDKAKSYLTNLKVQDAKNELSKTWAIVE